MILAWLIHSKEGFNLEKYGIFSYFFLTGGGGFGGCCVDEKVCKFLNVQTPRLPGRLKPSLISSVEIMNNNWPVLSSLLRFGNHDRLAHPDDCQSYFTCLLTGLYPPPPPAIVTNMGSYSSLPTIKMGKQKGICGNFLVLPDKTTFSSKVHSYRQKC